MNLNPYKRIKLMSDITSKEKLSKNKNSIFEKNDEIQIGSVPVNYGIVSNKALDLLIHNPSNPRDTRLIFYLLQKILRDDRGYVVLKRETIHLRTGIHKTHLSAVIKKLKTQGILFEYKIENDNYVYILNPEYVGPTCWFDKTQTRSLSLTDILRKFSDRLKDKTLVPEVTDPVTFKSTEPEVTADGYPKLPLVVIEVTGSANPKLPQMVKCQPLKSPESPTQSASSADIPKTPNTPLPKYPSIKIASSPYPHVKSANLDKLSSDHDSRLRSFFLNLKGPGIGSVDHLHIGPWINMVRRVLTEDKESNCEALLRQAITYVDECGHTFRGEVCENPVAFFTEVPWDEIKSDIQDYNEGQNTAPKLVQRADQWTPESLAQVKLTKELLSGIGNLEPIPNLEVEVPIEKLKSIQDQLNWIKSNYSATQTSENA